MRLTGTNKYCLNRDNLSQERLLCAFQGTSPFKFLYIIRGRQSLRTLCVNSFLLAINDSKVPVPDRLRQKWISNPKEGLSTENTSQKKELTQRRKDAKEKSARRGHCLSDTYSCPSRPVRHIRSSSVPGLIRQGATPSVGLYFSRFNILLAG